VGPTAVSVPDRIAGAVGGCHHSRAVPTYDYQCRSCGSITEVIHSMTEEGPTTCERCGGELRRVLYPTGIIFKGSGFYRTDSRDGGSSGTGSGAASKPASTPAADKPSGSTTPAATDAPASTGESGSA
jgi:putative FmdB family regulatory protein